MEINKKELKKTSRNFRQLATRVINSTTDSINLSIKMFISYIDETPIIIEYIQSILVIDENLEQDILEVSRSYGRLGLNTGETPSEEVSSVYQILKYIGQNPSIQTYALGRCYASSTKYQDMIKEFVNHLVMPFVNEINRYLADIATDMGYDEEIKFMITVNGGQSQLNIANDNSTINATQNIQLNRSEVIDVTAELKKNIEKELADNETIKGILLAQLELIKSESTEEEPKKSVLKTAIDTITTILKTVPSAITATKSAIELYGLISPLFLL